MTRLGQSATERSGFGDFKPGLTAAARADAAARIAVEAAAASAAITPAAAAPVAAASGQGSNYASNFT